MYIKKILFLSLFFFAVLANANMTKFMLEEKNFDQANQIIKHFLMHKKLTFTEKNNKILDIYFDLPELSYLKHGGYIRYRAVEYLSKKKNKKKYKESIDYTFDGNRTTLYSVKHYNSVKTLEGKHPLLNLIKRKERESFLSEIKQDGIKYPLRLKEILVVSRNITTYAFETNVSVHISLNEASALENTTKFILVSIESNSIALIKEIENAFGKKQKITNVYSAAFQQMQQHTFLFNLLVKYPYLIHLLYGLFFGGIGIIVILGLFWKRLMQQK